MLRSIMRRAITRLAPGLVAAMLAGGVAQAAFVPVPPTPAHRIAVNDVVRAVVIGDGVAYVGGDFTSATGSNGTYPRARVAAFDLDTGAVLPFRADTNGVVRALALRGPDLFVGGDFSTIGGVSRSRLAAVSAATGDVTGFRVDATGAVRALATVGTRLYVGGNFGAIGGVTQARLAAVDLTTGTVVPGFRPALDGTVLAVTAAPDGSAVYAGGAFRTVNGQSRNRLARFTTGGQLSGPVFANSSDYSVLALDINEDGSRVFAAIGGSGNQAAAFHTTTGARLWRQRADGDVQAIAYQAGNVYFGFHEGFGGDTSVRLLAADATTGQLEGAFRPSINSYWGVRALDATERGLLAGGEFTTVAGVEVGRAAFFDAQNGPPPPPPVTSFVTAGDTWRYRDTGTEAPGWAGAGFDDSTWPTGPAELGYGDGDEATVVGYGPSATNKYRTTWFRKTFPGTDDLPVTALDLSLLADDGAVVYLNGIEVARDNMPAGTITATTLAATNRSGTAETQFRSFPVDPHLLRAGTNTLAVEVHQDSSSSSDLSFDLALRATG